MKKLIDKYIISDFINAADDIMDVLYTEGYEAEDAISFLYNNII